MKLCRFSNLIRCGAVEQSESKFITTEWSQTKQGLNNFAHDLYKNIINQPITQLIEANINNIQVIAQNFTPYKLYAAYKL